MVTKHDLTQAMRADLERRVAEMSRTDAGAFGRIGFGEWLLVIAFAVVVPLVLWWWLG